jgi:hypothetical protein
VALHMLKPDVTQVVIIHGQQNAPVAGTLFA